MEERYTEQRNRTCCFTGHRPEKLAGSQEWVMEWLQKEIQNAISQGVRIFITGMAKGVDIWAAEAVLEARKIDPSLRLICAMPYRGFGLHWKDGWSERLQAVLKAADEVCYVCEAYRRSCFYERNRWMVDHSSRLIAVYTGETGGTHYSLQYAKKQGLLVIQLPSGGTERNG